MNELQPLDQATVRAYRVCFGSETGQIVLRDLMRFCKFRAEMLNNFDEGGRRVFLRILQFTQLTDEQILALFAGQTVLMPAERQDD